MGRTKKREKKALAFFNPLNSGSSMPWADVIIEISYLFLGRSERIFNVETCAPPSSGFVIT